MAPSDDVNKSVLMETPDNIILRNDSIVDVILFRFLADASLYILKSINNCKALQEVVWQNQNNLHNVSWFDDSKIKVHAGLELIPVHCPTVFFIVGVLMHTQSRVLWLLGTANSFLWTKHNLPSAKDN